MVDDGTEATEGVAEDGAWKRGSGLCFKFAGSIALPER